MSKEDFKNFVRTKPQLVKYVKEKAVPWQRLYEIYELYGEDRSVWNEYISDSATNRIGNSFNEIVNTVKNIDLDKLQNGIESIQNTISLIQNFGSGTNQSNSSTYEPRYKYQHMDD